MGISEENTEAVDYLNMSDEEILNTTPPEYTEEVSDESLESSDDEITDEVEDQDEESNTDELDEDPDNDEEGEGDTTDDIDTEDEEDSPSSESDDESEEEDETKDEEEDVTETDVSEFEKKILAPFKANGREMQVSNADEAIMLMQMGANYNKKMAEIKPSLKLMKMLDNNKLLDESKLSYLIDLDKKNPDAIAKLIKDSGFDPLDDDNKADASSYQPKTYTVDDSELDLDSTLDDLRGTEGFNETIDVISNKWDESSRQVILENPNIIRDINGHITSGVFDKIATEMVRERAFGRLQGMSDIQAYKYVGDMLDARGDFKEQVAPVQKQTPPAVVKTNKTKKADSKLNDRKRAASSTKSSPSNQTPKVDYLNMSDEEFEKLGNAKFI